MGSYRQLSLFANSLNKSWSGPLVETRAGGGKGAGAQRFEPDATFEVDQIVAVTGRQEEPAVLAIGADTAWGKQKSAPSTARTLSV